MGGQGKITMAEYIVCFIFWIVFVFFLYAFGNVLIKEEEAQSVKLMAGYLGYSFFCSSGRYNNTVSKF